MSVFASLFGIGNVTLNPGGCVAWAIAGLIAGFLAGHLVRGRGFGCLGDILLGLVGAVIGAFIISLVGVQVNGPLGFIGTTLVAFLGAFVLAIIGRLLGGSSAQRRRYDW